MLDSLLKHPKLWRANQLALLKRQEQPGIATGFAELDQLLPGQGWPNGALVEVMLASAGLGELRLFTPALQQLSQQQARWLAWIAPPFVPYPPALLNAGIDISRILVIHPRSHVDALWAVEHACKSGACSSVFAWLDDKKLNFKDTQRLQIAAKQGNTLTCLFRPSSNAPTQASMAELRLVIHAIDNGELRLTLAKRRGGWPIENIALPIAEVVDGARASSTSVAQQLQLWRSKLTPLAQTESPVDLLPREPFPADRRVDKSLSQPLH